MKVRDIKEDDIQKIIQPFELSEILKKQASNLVKSIYKILIEKLSTFVATFSTTLHDF